MYSSYQEESQTVGEQAKIVEKFFRDNQRKAFAMVRLSVSCDADALDIVQDAMERTYSKYGSKPESELKLLFFKILNNCLMDFHRKRKVLGRIFFWKSGDDDNGRDAEQTDIESPEAIAVAEQSAERTMEIISQLSVKQRQCYLLRVWEGLSVKETADIMQCTEGTVKTHLHRATTALQQIMQSSEQEVVQ